MASQSAIPDDRGSAGHDTEARVSDLILQAADDTRRVFEAGGDLQQGTAGSVAARGALRSVAVKFGWLGSFPSLERTPDAGGQEHDVWFDAAAQIVWKATHYNRFGIWAGRGKPAQPHDYLLRVYLTRHVFGIQWNVEGCEEDPFGRIRIVTTQPALKGAPAGKEHIDEFFHSLGFERQHLSWRDLWINRQLGVVAEDAHPDNFVMNAHGTVIPIDVPISPMPDDGVLA